MKRSLATPLALFGLLLAAAMVCTTWAQSGGTPVVVRPYFETPTAGRYQAVWTGSRLPMADTATGECRILNGETWDKYARPLDQAKAAKTTP